MTRLLPFFLAVSMVFTGCTFSRDIDGNTVDCIGIGDTPNPDYVYETSGWNIFMGILFFELLFIPPVVVLSSATSCPVRRATPRPAPSKPRSERPVYTR